MENPQSLGKEEVQNNENSESYTTRVCCHQGCKKEHSSREQLSMSFSQQSSQVKTETAIFRICVQMSFSKKVTRSCCKDITTISDLTLKIASRYKINDHFITGNGSF